MRSKRSPAPTGGVNRRLDALIVAALIAACLAVFSGVTTHEFVALDDDVYVTENPMVKAGLSGEGLRWAATTFHEYHWHPLTWVSHMADVQMYGPNASRHLLGNLGLHTAASILLFLALCGMTGRLWPSAIVAALFAVHPLHVESVAWVAERKDVLSGFFFMLTLWLYARYVRRPDQRARLAAVIAAYVLGLLAKPMLVTLPFVLVLLDYWPLNRLQRGTIIEKWALFVLSAASAVVTYLAMTSHGATKTLVRYPADVRLGNAVMSYAGYLKKALWPFDLCAFYPFHAVAPSWVLASLVLMLLLTAAAYALRRGHPWLLVGWLWYCGMLVPVIGLVQVGGYAMADRYTYLPMVGIFLAVVWEIAGLVDQRVAWRRVAAVGATLLLLGFAWVARLQVGFWQDSVTLYERALAVTTDNGYIEASLGSLLAGQGKFDEALPHIKNAVRLDPSSAHARIDLGRALDKLGNRKDALAAYDEAARLIHTDDATNYFYLGVSMAQAQQLAKALENFNKTLALNPNYFAAHANAAIALMALGRAEEAIPHFEAVTQANPKSPVAHNNLGNALAAVGRLSDARTEFTQALQLDPKFEPARRNLEHLGQFVKPGP
jgi:tetratricopeptide (TPR) repeat protein